MKRSWTDEQLLLAISPSSSWREVCGKLGISAKSNNQQKIKEAAEKQKADTDHFWQGRSKTYSKGNLRVAIESSKSYAQVLEKLNLNKYGSAYKTLKQAIKECGFSTEHFLGQRWNKGGTSPSTKQALKDIMVADSTYTNTSSLKKRLIREGIFQCKCQRCGNTEWQGQEIPLQLHHKSGEKQDNRLENLEMLCPNCHSLTWNWTGRKPEQVKNKEYMVCLNCGQTCVRNSKTQKYCSSKCSNQSNAKLGFRKRKVEDRPSKEELAELIENNSWCALGRKFGVSDNAVRKWAKQYGLLE